MENGFSVFIIKKMNAQTYLTTDRRYLFQTLQVGNCSSNASEAFLTLEKIHKALPL